MQFLRATRPHTLTRVRQFPSSRLLLLFLVAALITSAAKAQNLPTLRVEVSGLGEEEVGRIFDRLDPARIPTGLLHDQVGSLVDVTRFDGSKSAPNASLDTWRQLYHELSRSSVVPNAQRHARGGRTVQGFPGIEQISEVAGEYLSDDSVPLGLMDIAFNKIRPDALDAGLLRFDKNQLVESSELTPDREDDGRPRSSYTTHRAFALTVFRERAAGPRIRFVLPEELYVARGSTHASRLKFDFDDNRGLRRLRPGEHVDVDYDSPGIKTITLKARINGELLTASTTFIVAAAAIPNPDVTWSAAAEHSYEGAAASYDAHIFLGAGHTSVTRPVVFVEGFDSNYSDPAKRRTWQDIYEILLQEDFVNRLRALGYDAIIMKLGNATDYVQRNAFALEDLLNRLAAAMPPDEEIVVVGPSMGGLIGRYALASMERNNLPHRARLYISLDAPHGAANFPLGTQHFLEFFDGDSELARLGKQAVNSPAARQMLAYQYRAFPNVDPLRTILMADLDLYGFPSTRNIAVANGSGEAVPQLGNELVGFRPMQPGDKIVDYRYRSFLVDLDGDVWALPNGTPETRIFEGRKDVIGPHYRALNVYVSGTLPYDNSPGGMRATQQQIADSNAPYGDIKTAFPNHSWIPTTSALKLATPDLSYDVARDVSGLTNQNFAGKRSSGSFDAIYYPSENQDHVFATDENVRFVLDEIDTRFRTSRTVAESRTFNSGQQIVLASNVVLRFLSDVSIDPGVEFVLGANAMILFEGRVLARGTASAPIHFRRGGSSSWKWLELRADNNLFEHVVLDGGNKTVEIRSKNNVFRYCRFENGWRGVSSNYALAGGRSSFTLEHSLVTDNASVGVVAYHTDASFRNSTVRRSGQAGIYFNDANTTLFYQSIVEKNALSSTSRSGVEILGGSFVTLFGPDGGRGYTRISDNIFHEINVSLSATGLVLGYPPVRGGYNSVFDVDEGSSAASEKLINSYLRTRIYANATFWGGIVPNSADLRGQFSVGTVLFSDPTSAAGAPPMLATEASGVSASQFADTRAKRPMGASAYSPGATQPEMTVSSGIEDPSSGPAGRMREIRKLLRENSRNGANADLLEELYVLHRLDPNDLLGEKTANLAVISESREQLKHPPLKKDQLGRRTGEVAVLLGIRDALVNEQYADASALVRDYAPLILHPDLRRRLLLEQISLLEQQERFPEALALLEGLVSNPALHSVVESAELYDIIREELQEKTLGLAVMHEEETPEVGRELLSPAVTALFEINPAYPNPFNPVTVIPFALREPADVRIDVFDVLGRLVETVSEGIYGAGTHRATFHADGLVSGVYLVRAELKFEGGRTAAYSQRITLLK